jgi:hypothetical protein
VLDRENQHLRICPDSQAVVRNCNIIQRASITVSLAVALLKGWSLIAISCGTSGAFLDRVAAALKPAIMRRTIGIALVAWWLAGKVRREFYFKYTEEFRDRDLKNIPKIWVET